MLPQASPLVNYSLHFYSQVQLVFLILLLTHFYF